MEAYSRYDDKQTLPLPKKLQDMIDRKGEELEEAVITIHNNMLKDRERYNRYVLVVREMKNSFRYD